MIYFFHKLLLIQQKQFEHLTIADSFHTPYCIVVQCSVGVGVTGQQTVNIVINAELMIVESLLLLEFSS